MIHTIFFCIITIRSILVKDSSKTRNTTNQYFNNMLQNDLVQSVLEKKTYESQI